MLESLVKTGLPSRGEMTDAAMAARAKCVLLNKAPFLPDAVGALSWLLVRMSEHQDKKTARLPPQLVAEMVGFGTIASAERGICGLPDALHRNEKGA